MTPEEFRALVKVHAPPGRARAIPRQQHPDRISDTYTRAIQRVMLFAIGEVRAKLVPLLQRAAESAGRVATSDAIDDELGDMIDELRRAWDRRWSRRRLSALAEPYADQTATYHAAQLNRQIRAALGNIEVDAVGSEPWLAGAARDFTRENVALIKSIPARFFDELERTLTKQVADGVRWETMVGTIEERYEVSRSRSKLIARDQVGKYYGDLNRVRQRDLGIDRFVWRTMRDNRVREEHEDLDGRSFSWSQAPFGGPGEPVLCRCYADPDLSSVQ